MTWGEWWLEHSAAAAARAARPLSGRWPVRNGVSVSEYCKPASPHLQLGDPQPQGLVAVLKVGTGKESRHKLNQIRGQRLTIREGHSNREALSWLGREILDTVGQRRGNGFKTACCEFVRYECDEIHNEEHMHIRLLAVVEPEAWDCRAGCSGAMVVHVHLLCMRFVFRNSLHRSH